MQDSNNPLSQKHEYWRYIPYVLIVLVVFVANFNHIFGIDVYIHDDIVRYTSAVAQKDLLYLRKICSFDYVLRWVNICPLLVRIAIWELCKINSALGRLFFVLAFQIPLSISIYYFLQRFWRLPLYLSLLIAILPACNPAQHEIPAYLDGSYPVAGTLLAMISLLFAAKFLEKNQIYQWLLASFFYYLANTQMQNAVFLLVPILCYFWFFKRDKRQFIYISLPYIFFAAYRVFYSILKPRGAATITDLPSATIIQRYSDMFKYADPFSFIWGKYEFAHAIVVSLFLVCALIFFIYRYKKSFSLQNLLSSFNQSRECQFFYFSVIWYITTAIVFVVISPYFPIYHTYLPSFGLSAAIVYSLHIVFKLNLAQRRQGFIAGIVIIVLALTRVYTTHATLVPINTTFQIIKTELARHDYPDDSQIVILGQFDYNLGRGIWPMSSGMINQFTNRRDFKGIMPYEFNFYDPFTGDSGRNWGKAKMTGLKLSEPIFIYRYDNANSIFKQLTFGLQWFKESFEQLWILHQFDAHTGYPIRQIQGKGIQEYHDLLKELSAEGVSLENIAWGNPEKFN